MTKFTGFTFNQTEDQINLRGIYEMKMDISPLLINSHGIIEALDIVDGMIILSELMEDEAIIKKANSIIAEARQLIETFEKTH